MLPLDFDDLPFICSADVGVWTAQTCSVLFRIAFRLYGQDCRAVVISFDVSGEGIAKIQRRAKCVKGSIFEVAVWKVFAAEVNICFEMKVDACLVLRCLIISVLRDYGSLSFCRSSQYSLLSNHQPTHMPLSLEGTAEGRNESENNNFCQK